MLKPRFSKLVLLLLVLLLSLCSGTARAQFWKKIFKKDEPQHTHSKPRPVPAKPVANTDGKKKVEEKKKATDFTYPATELKKHYRIDVILPLYLDELIKNGRAVYKDHIPDKALSGVGFYEGVKMATDTLQELGYNMDVYIHDSGDPLESVETLINAGKLDSSDLIIGAVNAQYVATLAKFAAKHHINFVSTLSPADGGVKDNGYFTLLQPSLQTHCEWLRKQVAKESDRKHVLLYHRSTSTVDEQAYTTLSKEEGKHFTEVKCNVKPTTDQLFLLLDSETTNTIIIPVIDVAYSGQLIKQLRTAFPNYRFDIYGMPSWKGAEFMKNDDSLANTTISITEPYYYDGTTAAGQNFMTEYRKQYGGRPGEYAYRGYETLFWYANLLHHYGTIFNNKMNDDAAAIFTRFEVEKKKNSDNDLLYYENRHVYLMRCNSGSCQVIQ